jgi:LEA14-like dessication related protein
MVARRIGFFFLLLAFASATVVACSKPQPPKLTPKDVSVVAVSTAGLDLLLKIEATNPNGFTLSAQSFTGKAKLDDTWEMGTVTVSKPITLPPRTPTMLEVPMRLPWTDAMALAPLATAHRPVPYVVEGTVRIGGDKLNVEVPYSMSGTITPEQIANAALKALPRLPR